MHVNCRTFRVSPSDDQRILFCMNGGARIVRHGRYVVFQLAEVAVPRALFAEILRRIDRLRPKPLRA